MNLKEKIYLANKISSIKEILEDCGFTIYKIPCQIRCPIHKIGTESTPSARIYEDDSFVWCFTCREQFSSVKVYSTQKDLTEEEAADYIIGKYKPSRGQSTAILKDFYTPYKPKEIEDLTQIMENFYKEFKGKLNYTEYRALLLSGYQYLGVIGDLDETEREATLCRFLRNQRQKYASPVS
jgi:hypothetical protein